MSIRVKEYVWNRDDPDAIHGVVIQRHDRNVFVPDSSLRIVADKLHDLADDFESRQ